MIFPKPVARSDIDSTRPTGHNQEETRMKITAENAMEHAQWTMTKRDVDGYNKLNGTNYSSKEELLDDESAENVAEFYQ